MRRKSAVVASAAGLVPFAHVGWGFKDRAEFRARAGEYIADGLAHNQWVQFVGEGSREQLRAELATMPAIADRLHDGGIGVTPAMEFYAMASGSDVVHPKNAVAAWVAAVQDAVEDGCAGFRVVTDATALARRPDQRDAFADFEFRLDQQMAVLPASALCAYDTSQLADDANGLVCLHPYVRQKGPTFRLYAQPGAAFALTGYIDVANDALFTTALQRIWAMSADDPLIIDAQGLEFVSHQHLYTIDHYARTDGRKVVIHTEQRVLTRLGGLLDLTNVQVVPPPNSKSTSNPAISRKREPSSQPMAAS
jgi:anti-anti-sigma regulatory factor